MWFMSKQFYVIFYETIVNLSSQSAEGSIGQAMTKAQELTDLILQPELLGITLTGTEDFGVCSLSWQCHQL